MLVLGACADDPAGGVGGDSGGESTAVDSAVDPGQSALVLNFEDEAGPGGALTWFRNSGTAPVSARTVTGVAVSQPVPPAISQVRRCSCPSTPRTTRDMRS